MVLIQDLDNKLRQNAEAIASLDEDVLSILIDIGQCPFEPLLFKDTDLGIFICPVCKERVIAGIPHTKYRFSEEELAYLSDLAILAGEVKIAFQL